MKPINEDMLFGFHVGEHGFDKESVMAELREAVDTMETLTASRLWPVPTYGDMMFRV